MIVKGFCPWFANGSIKHQTVENAIDVVGCLGDPSSYDHQSIIEFLEENSDILEQSNDLRAVKATALFHAGQFEDSRKVSTTIFCFKGLKMNDLFLDLRIAVLPPVIGNE